MTGFLDKLHSCRGPLKSFSLQIQRQKCTSSSERIHVFDLVFLFQKFSCSSLMQYVRSYSQIDQNDTADGFEVDNRKLSRHVRKVDLESYNSVSHFQKVIPNQFDSIVVLDWPGFGPNFQLQH